MSSGAQFRPPIIVTSGPSLLIRFYANGGTGLGYKAFYSFVIGHAYDESQPITDCGGYVENLGGAITMINMVGQGAKTYDCVWLIRPPRNFLHMKRHMYLKIVTFADMGKREGKIPLVRHADQQSSTIRDGNRRENLPRISLEAFFVSDRPSSPTNEYRAI